MIKNENIEILKKRINLFFNVDIENKSQTLYETYVRTIYYHFCKKITPSVSLVYIAKTVNRNHATIIYSLNKFDNAIKYDKKFKTLYDSFIGKYSMYLNDCKSFKNESQEKILDLLDFIYTLTEEEKSLMFIDIENLKLKYKKAEDEGIL
jgi:hypothetical protein